jgi:hypothetical protein
MLSLCEFDECRELMQMWYGYKDSEAAQVASIAQVLPIFIAPFLGYVHGRYGKRCSTCTTSSLL